VPIREKRAVGASHEPASIPSGICRRLPRISIAIMSGNIGSMARPATSLFAIIVLASLLLPVQASRGLSHAALSPATPRSDEFSIFPIYSERLTDPWNRIFHCLFTRGFETRISEDRGGADDGPYLEGSAFLNLRVSTRTWHQFEAGDHPIDPLYSPPANSLQGSRQLLANPPYEMLLSALQDALTDATPRTPLARALMQSDLWSAYDLLHWDLFPQDRGTILDAHKRTVSDLMAQLLKKLALSREEIESLPDNYAAARQQDSLPDLFSPASEWIEMQWFPGRTHDAQAEFRRVSRLFVKPAHPSRTRQEFLNSLRDRHGDPTSDLAGAVILIQPLLIDSTGHLVPSHLTTDVEVRLFEWRPDGSFQRTNIHTYELSREMILNGLAPGGLAVQDEYSPAYLSAGGSYGFAEPAFRPKGAAEGTETPVIVKLRTRCSVCHGPDLTSLMSFEIAEPPGQPGPAVKVLDQTAHQAAEYDVAQKSRRAEWKALRRYFEPDLRK
jgi:hypothetical protein